MPRARAVVLEFIGCQVYSDATSICLRLDSKGSEKIHTQCLLAKHFHTLLLPLGSGELKVPHPRMLSILEQEDLGTHILAMRTESQSCGTGHGAPSIRTSEYLVGVPTPALPNQLPANPLLGGSR